MIRKNERGLGKNTELPAKWGMNNERKKKIKCQDSHDTIHISTNTYKTHIRL